MNLDVITHTPERATHDTPVLFVHGAWHGAWCWEEYFLPYFAGRGYAAHALSLRGHGSSERPARLFTTRIDDYVSDVDQVFAQLSAAPVLVGHSMGGLVVQKYLEKNDAPAAVLLASVPVGGALGTTLRIAGRHPLAFIKANLLLSLYPIIGSPALTREAFFSSDISPEKLEGYFHHMQDESYFAFLDMLFSLPKPYNVNTDVLVLGAAGDTIFTPDEVVATAEAYGTTAEIFPGMAHDMMLEGHWQKVADRIIAWLRQMNIS
ncbi:MAG: alpha/beta fold hydrolase [Pseudomonadota bacterium]